MSGHTDHIQAAQRLLHKAEAETIAQQLPEIGHKLAEAMERLGADPSLARSGTVAMMLGGAAGLVRRLQEALARTAGDADGQAR
jgi:hypothetical protein